MSSQRPNGNVFISYRRSDSHGLAGRLYDRLVKHFGNGSVFMDVISIEPGMNFHAEIGEAVGRCDVLLVIIGPNWLSARDSNDGLRLDNPDDFLRLEVEAALLREIRLIPVLIDGSSMPTQSELPPSLAPLVSRNATHLRHGSFDDDYERLQKVLDKVLADAAAQRETDKLPFNSKASAVNELHKTRSRLAAATVAVAIALVTVVAFRLSITDGDGREQAPQIGEVTGSTTGELGTAGPGLASVLTDPSWTPSTSSDGAPSTLFTNITEQSQTTEPNMSAKIQEPVADQAISSPVHIRGIASVPVEMALWIVIVSPDGVIHLTTRSTVPVNDAGEWESTAGVGRGSGDAGNAFVLHAVAAPKTNSEFSLFVQAGKTGGFATMPPDVVQLDSVRIILK